MLFCEGNLITTRVDLTTNEDVYVWGYRGYAQQRIGINVISKPATSKSNRII